MDAIILQVLNGLEKGGAYALIALGLTLIFGTLGVVNFAHGALFMMGAFCAVVMRALLSMEVATGEMETTAWGTEVAVTAPYVTSIFGDFGNVLIDWAVPVSILLTIPVMLFIGWAMERGLIRHFYKRPHAEQILVTFGLAIVLSEIIKAIFGANPIPVPAPSALDGMVDFSAVFGSEPGKITYPMWRFVYFLFSASIIITVFCFLRFTTFGMVVRAGMEDRETVGLLGIDIGKKFTFMFAISAAIAGLAGAMYTPIISPNYNIGMEFLVLSFIVVVVGGMGSLGGAVAAGFLLGLLQSFAAMTSLKSWIYDKMPDILPDGKMADIVQGFVFGIDQIIIYLVAVVVLLLLPRGLMGRKGVMET